jgi:hypothetical protein
MADNRYALDPLPLKDPKGGALSVTRATGIGAAIVAVLTAVNGTWNTIFGSSTPTWAKPVVMMVVIGAWALVAAADLLGRAYVAAHRAVAKGGTRVIPVQSIPAKYEKGTDQDCLVAAARLDPDKPDDPDFLVLKADGEAAWVPHGDLKFTLTVPQTMAPPTQYGGKKGH